MKFIATAVAVVHAVVKILTTAVEVFEILTTAVAVVTENNHNKCDSATLLYLRLGNDFSRP